MDMKDMIEKLEEIRSVRIINRKLASVIEEAEAGGE